MNNRNTGWKIQKITESLNELLQHKNKNYGDSALNGLRIFNKNINNSSTSIGIRLDDKLARIKHSDDFRKNDIADLLGYLVLLCANEDWLSFNDLID
jgi:hypothetical protein